MNTRHSLLPAAALVVLAQLPAAATAQAAAPATHPAAVAAKAPIATRSPAEWIQFDDLTVTPVVDEVSRHLAAARTALAHKDNAKAAQAMHAAARALKAQATEAAQLDSQRAAAEKDVRAGLTALARKLDTTAAQIKAHQVNSIAALDKTIGKAQRAELERRWLLTDVTTWYPVAAEPQRHFGAAIEAYAKRDYKAAAAEVRKGAAFVRLEAARAVGDGRKELDAADADLERAAAALDKGTLAARHDLEKTFASADHALALAHRTRAAESWAHRSYGQVGYELEAAAHGLENGAAWVGSEAKAAATVASADARAIGDKLARGGVWAKDEIAKAFESLGSGLNKLGESIGSRNKASRFDAGA